MHFVTRRLSLHACWQQARHDTPGTRQDAEEVVALHAYMDGLYVCASLTRAPVQIN